MAMPTPFSPTARRYELARRLRELREAAGRTPEEVAEELACSLTKVSRLETGHRAAQPLDIKVLCRFYGVPQTVQDELMAMAADARRRGWWQDFRSLDEQTRTFIGLESAAVDVLQVEILRVPGLLQTSDYIRAWVPYMRPPGFWDPGVIDEIVEARLRRQDRIANNALRLAAVIDEAAFIRYPRDGAAMMADQVKHIAVMATQPNVTVQVVGLSAGPHAGLDGSFQVLRFPDGQLNDVLMIEGQYGHSSPEDPEIVGRYQSVFHHLASSVALGPDDTLTWLQQRHEQLQSEATTHSHPRRS
jgi:transcriptional regulator with XRE-family HTH domain